jgi:NAD(P)-dependent dehydrogenase (short-subunit alcohol dehydrogenase family)
MGQFDELGAVVTGSPVGETSVAAYDEAMPVNARAPFLMIRHAARVMPDGGPDARWITGEIIRVTGGLP